MKRRWRRDAARFRSVKITLKPKDVERWFQLTHDHRRSANGLISMLVRQEMQRIARIHSGKSKLFTREAAASLLRCVHKIKHRGVRA